MWSTRSLDVVDRPDRLLFALVCCKSMRMDMSIFFSIYKHGSLRVRSSLISSRSDGARLRSFQLAMMLNEGSFLFQFELGMEAGSEVGIEFANEAFITDRLTCRKIVIGWPYNNGVYRLGKLTSYKNIVVQSNSK